MLQIWQESPTPLRNSSQVDSSRTPAQKSVRGLSKWYAHEQSSNTARASVHCAQIWNSHVQWQLIYSTYADKFEYILKIVICSTCYGEVLLTSH